MSATPPPPRRLLLTGIPGTGKTEAGHILANDHGFVHLDAERFVQQAPPGTTWNDFLGQVRREIDAGRDVVITWGFVPGVDDNTVRRLQAMGFRMVWFDGNRAAARREFLKRGTVGEDLLNLQMARIATLDLVSFQPMQFNPFDANGEFLPRSVIAGRLVALA